MTAVHADQRRRVDRQVTREPLPVDHAVTHQVQRQRHHGLQADDAVGRAHELQRLLVRGVRGVVAAYRVDDAVGQRRADRHAVGLRAQRRVHLGVGVVAVHRLVGELPVVRAGLGGDGDALGLGHADQLHGAGAGDMQEMHAPAGERGDLDVAGHHRALRRAGSAGQPHAGGGQPFVHGAAGGQARILGMDQDGQLELQRVFQAAAHHHGVGDRLAVVRKRHRSALAELAELGELLPFLAQGDRAHRPQPGEPDAARLADQEFHVGTAVGDRPRVGHRADAGEPGRDRGGQPALQVLLVLEPRFPQVHVQVDQAGRHHLPGAVDGAVGRRSGVGADGGDHPVADEQVADAVDAVLRVDHAPAAQQQRHRAVLIGQGRCGTGPPCARPRRWSPGPG